MMFKLVTNSSCQHVIRNCVFQEIKKFNNWDTIKVPVKWESGFRFRMLQCFPALLGTLFTNLNDVQTAVNCNNLEICNYGIKLYLNLDKGSGCGNYNYYNDLRGFLKSLSNFKEYIMPKNITKEAMAAFEENTQNAQNLIDLIYTKLTLLQSCNPELGPNVQKLIQENNALKQEMQAWKEMLLLQQIQNGGNPTVRDPRTVECSAVVSTVPVKEEPAEKTTPAPTSQPEPTDSNANVPQQGKKGKKGGGASTVASAPKAPKAKAAEAPAAQENDDADVGRLDLRIGLIKECSRHPDADSLYVEKIDVGEPNVRTVISGLVKHVPLEAMQNRMVVVLCNLKPSKMRGIMSEAMVMCASSPEKVEILVPPPGSAPGDFIEVEGFVRRPEAVMNPKKKIFETVAPDLKTNGSKQATYKGVPWTVPGKGFIVSETLCDVNVK